MAKVSFKEGDRVTLLADVPHVGYFKGTIRIVQKDVPGKKIGVELDQPAINGHSLEGTLQPERVDPSTGVRMGRGWWAVEENLEKIEE